MHSIHLHNILCTAGSQSLFVLNAAMAALPVLCDNGVPTGNTVLPTTTGEVMISGTTTAPDIKVQNICL